MRRILLGAAVAWLAGCGGDERLNKAGVDAKGETRVLTMATRDLVFYDNAGLPAFVKAVEKRSRGRLEIRLVQDIAVNATSRGPVRKGKVDLAWEGEGYPGVPAWEVPYLPFLIDSHALQRELFRQDYDERLLAAARSRRWLEPLTVLPGELGRPYSLSTPLRTAEDWRGRGMHSRYPVDGTRGKALRAMGVARLKRDHYATTENLDGRDYTVTDWLDRGLQFNGIGDFGVTGTYNAITFTRPVVIVANRRRFAKLRPQEQQWLRAAAADGQRAALEWVGSPDEEHISGNCRTTRLRALLAPDQEIAKLRSKVLSVYRAAEDPAVRELVDLVERSRAAVEPARFGLPGECDGPVPPARVVARDDGRHVIDGRYRTEVTTEEFVRAGLMDAEIHGPDFAGVWTATLRTGKWTLTRRAKNSTVNDEQVVKEGTYRANGSRVTLFEKGMPPFTFRFEKVGEGNLRFTPEHPMTFLYTAIFGKEWPRLR